MEEEFESKNPILHNHYPSTSQAWLIFGVIIIGQLVVYPIQYLFEEGSGLGVFLMYTIALSIGLTFAVRQKSRSRTPILGHQKYIEGEPVSFSVYALCTLLIPCMIFISGPIGQLIPIPDEFMEQMEKILGNFGVFQFLTIVVAAPLLEESIFRGIILEGFLKQFSPKKAILYSALMFALIHMNPWQFTHTFLLGGVIGWVYYRTKSIWPCIWIHFVNNGLVFLAGAISNTDALGSAQPESGLAMYLLIPIGAALLYGLMGLIDQAIGEKQPQWQIRDEEE